MITKQTFLNNPRVSIGTGDITTNKYKDSISIGYKAGLLSQGTNSIAIGSLAGITNQTNNSIILNASGTDLNATNSGLYIKPIRNNGTSNILCYDPTSGEITTNVSSVGNAVTLDTTQTIIGQKTFTLPVIVSAGTGIVNSGTYPRLVNTGQSSSTFVTPGLQIGSGTNNGIYSSRTNLIDIGVLGDNYISLQPEGIYGSIPAIVFNQRVQLLYGTNASAPSLIFDNQNSGFYSDTNGIISLAIAGSLKYKWSSNSFEFAFPGTSNSPTLTWTNSGSTSGLYGNGLNDIRMSTSGTDCMSFTSNINIANKGIKIGTNGSDIKQVLVGSCQFTNVLLPNSSDSQSITFSSAFTSPPYVVCSVNSNDNTSQRFIVSSALSITTTGMTICVANSSNQSTNGTIVISWIAKN